MGLDEVTELSRIVTPVCLCGKGFVSQGIYFTLVKV